MLASPIVSKSVLLSSFALTRPAASGLAAPFVRLLNSKIPSESTKPAHQRPSSSSSRQGEPAGGDLGLDGETVSLLERLSLVDFGNVEAIHRLGEAVDFAKPLSEVDTKGVEPLFTLLEEEALRLREDEVTEGDCREEILSNASQVEEDYFVAPPGNIPLKVEEDKYHKLQKRQRGTKAQY